MIDRLRNYCEQNKMLFVLIRCLGFLYVAHWSGEMFKLYITKDEEWLFWLIYFVLFAVFLRFLKWFGRIKFGE